MISYTITVCDEEIELNLLLNYLINSITDDDEIIIQADNERVTEEVEEVVELEEVKPIVPNPEIQEERVEFKIGRNGFQSMEDKIREKLNNLNK